ncbi:hypothetical protein DFP72DRAFT_915673 [Ephemerocybe angulata]|uniref:Uncharacterized protein n=1 Tax=Ephemerocybe angulata TaxID=980116 RepID=A0A8H6M256_9AGAR|nr:hypothetical protein DFP72DRAFT_915673 [Tulosesus angulatus]
MTRQENLVWRRITGRCNLRVVLYPPTILMDNDVGRVDFSFTAINEGVLDVRRLNHTTPILERSVQALLRDHSHRRMYSTNIAASTRGRRRRTFMVSSDVLASRSVHRKHATGRRCVDGGPMRLLRGGCITHEELRLPLLTRGLACHVRRAVHAGDLRHGMSAVRGRIAGLGRGNTAMIVRGSRVNDGESVVGTTPATSEQKEDRDTD